MEKVYDRINFEDRPSKNTPLNAENLNKMDSAIDALDDRIVEQDEAFEEYKIAESEQMSEAYERIRELEGTSSDYDNRISGAEGNIESLQADVTGVEKNVSNLEGDVNNNYEAFYSFREGAREDIENLQAEDITIKKSIETLGTRLDGVEDNTPSLTNNLLATEAGTALDAVQGKVLNDKIKVVDDAVGIETTVIDGIPNWRERGADTWCPFSSAQKSMVFALGVDTSQDGENAESGSASIAIPSENVESINIEMTEYFHGDSYTDSYFRVYCYQSKYTHAGSKLISTLYTDDMSVSGESMTIDSSQLDTSTYPYIYISAEVSNDWGDRNVGRCSIEVNFK